MNGSSGKKTASVAIPTLNAMQHLPVLIPMLRAQRPDAPEEILIIDSGSRDGTIDYAGNLKNEVGLIEITHFTHGRARNLGVRQARGEFVVFLSQDAVPKDDAWLAQLLAPFARKDVAATFSRQVPRPDANPMEQFFLKTHFPNGDKIYMRREGQQELLFQDNVFFSNVASAARRSVLLEHPFDETLIMSEDQQFALDVMMAGLTVVYAPASVVLHSHNYTFLHALRRYFDSAYSLTRIFDGHDLPRSTRMGLSYLRRECAMMLRHHPLQLPRYAAYVLAKTLGTVLGHFAENIPASVVPHLSLHRSYWERSGYRPRDVLRKAP